MLPKIFMCFLCFLYSDRRRGCTTPSTPRCLPNWIIHSFWCVMNACVDEVAKHYAKCRNTSLDPLCIPCVFRPTSMSVWRQQEVRTYNAEWARIPQVVKKIFSEIPSIFTFIFFRLVSDSLWHICLHYCSTFESLLIYSYVIYNGLLELQRTAHFT